MVADYEKADQLGMLGAQKKTHQLDEDQKHENCYKNSALY